METKLVKVKNEEEYKKVVDEHLALGYILIKKTEENGETTLTFQKQKPKVKGKGLYNACKIVGLVYFIVDIVATSIMGILAIVGIALLAKSNNQEQVITGGTLLGVGLAFMVLCLVATLLAKKALDNIKQQIVVSKGAGVANCIFNTGLGVLMIIIWNKKQAKEI